MLLLGRAQKMAHAHHRIAYIEFTVKDLAEAKRFFGQAFGWAFNDYGPRYLGIQGDDGEVGGITLGDTQPGGPLVIIYSDDLEASERAVKAAGGSVVKEAFDFPGGRRFEFTDPSGNRMAVWSKG